MTDSIITINYDNNSININDGTLKETIPICFTYGGKYKYLGLFEVLLSKLYPYEIGKTFSFDNNPPFSNPNEWTSKYVKDLNKILPDYLQIEGTNTFSFTKEINNHKLQISVISEKAKSRENRMTFSMWLHGIDWDQKNELNAGTIREVSIIKKDKEPNKDGIFWNYEAIKNKISDFRTETFDESLLTPIGTQKLNLHEYVSKKLFSIPNNRICIVEGQGGAGKTTSIKYAIDKLNQEGHTAVLVYSYELSLRGLKVSDYIADQYIDGIDGQTTSNKKAVLDLAEKSNHKSRTIVFIDGIDELSEAYYKDNICKDIKDMLKVCSKNLYFVISTRQNRAIIELLTSRSDTQPIIVKTNSIELKDYGVGEKYQTLLKKYPQFKTPLFISMIRGLSNINNSSVTNDYGHSQAKQITNKTELFDAWMDLRTTHSKKLGIEPYYYTHLLTLTAHESLRQYMKNNDRTLPRSFFEKENIYRLLKDNRGQTRHLIRLSGDEEELISILMSTGLITTTDHDHYMFANMEYMLYLAGYYSSLIFVDATKERRHNMIETLITDSIEGSNPDFNLALVSYPEFTFNRIMDLYRKKECKLSVNEKKAMLRLGLAVGYEKTRDVDENIRILMDWYRQNCDHKPESAAIIWQFNATLYSMMTKGNLNPLGIEKHLNYITNCFNWMIDYFAPKADEYITENVIPFDYYERILGNLGAVEIEYARYYKVCNSIEDSERHKLIKEKLIKAIHYHNESYMRRRDMTAESEEDSKILSAGLARNIIGMSTDLFYMSSYLLNENDDYRANLLFISIFGGDTPFGIHVPGYIEALRLQGSYKIEGNIWKRGSKKIIRESEPCVIFRRMAGGCKNIIALVGDTFNDVNILQLFYDCISYAADDLYLVCTVRGKYSESKMEFYRDEIRNFVIDIKDKYLPLLELYKNDTKTLEVKERMEPVLQIYNESHYANVKMDSKHYRLLNY